MSSEGYPSVAYVPPAEGGGDVVGSAVVEAVAAQYSADAHDGAADDAQLHDGAVEILGAGGAVDAGLSEVWGEHFLVCLYGQEVDFPCYVLSHVLKIPSGNELFNPKPFKGLTKTADSYYITSVTVNYSRTEEEYGRCYF